jgi:hypothetical protein
VTLAASRPPVATLTTAPFVTAVDHARPFMVPGLLWRSAMAIGDFLAAIGIVLCIPVVILVIGTPLALGVRLLLWIAGVFWGALSAAAS